METNLKVFDVGGAVEQLQESVFSRILLWTCTEPLRYICLPGVFYHRGLNDFDVSEIANLPIMPWYCKIRIPPQAVDGRRYISGLYIKAPVCIIQSSDETLGLRFAPYLFGSKPIPVFFGLRRVGEKTEFELGILRQYTLWRRSKEQFQSWTNKDRSFSEELISLGDALNDLVGMGPVDHVLLRGETVGDIVEQVVRVDKCHQVPYPWLQLENSCRFHFSKSISWLLGMYHPWARSYLTFRGRNPKSHHLMGNMTLPIYNTLATDFYRLEKYFSKDSRIAKFSECACNLHFADGAYRCVAGDAAVFRNTARLSPRRRSMIFGDHLGVGLAGYPGGQAVVVRSLAERFILGDRNPTLCEVTKRAAKWLRMAQQEDGSWHRTYIGPACLEPEDPSAQLSLGACAEGAMALLAVYQAFGAREDLDAAQRALKWVNHNVSDTMVLSGYFRDCAAKEAEAASGIFAALANLLAFDIFKDKGYLETAKLALQYCLGWHRWWLDDGMDSIQHSFTPRVATCQTVWAAHAYYDYYVATGEAFWKRMSEKAIQCLAYDNQYPGYGDSVFNDQNLCPYSVGFEAGYPASAILRFTIQVIKHDLESGDILPPDHSVVLLKSDQRPSFRSDLSYFLHSVRSRILEVSPVPSIRGILKHVLRRT